MSIARVFIANRGEIAVRVIRACRALGMESVVGVSEADRDSMAATLADRAVCIGPSRAPASYLNTDALLAAALGTGCDAVHPGYGFLAENADFGAACEANGLVFVGPRPETVRTMGNKLAARQIAQEAGVPVVPGSASVATFTDAAGVVEEIGYPVLLKAAAGGGGRGIRIVHRPEELPGTFSSAAAEADAAFGDGTLYVERYIGDGRHIEVQVFGDQQGDVVHFGERDCSLQRRYQKIVEEAPATLVPAQLRTEIVDAAVALAKGIGYTNAGTVEFIYDQQRREFHFLEMNTRLQVEHPVTELVVGMDLVELQLRVAAGEALPYTQEEILERRRGHAMEARINAEDPAGGKFLPSPGPITRFRRPDGFGVRVDAGYDEGDEVSQFYDNLVAKLVVWGADREHARRRLIRALEETEIEGIATTIPAHLAILEHPDFIAGKHSTKWVEERLDLSGVSATPSAPPDDEEEGERRVQRDVDVEVDGRRFKVKLWVPEIEPTVVASAGPATGAKRARPRAGAGAAGGAAGSGTVTVPMQGTIVKVLVAAGDTVEVGQALCILEAMKMENHINADKAGTVTEIKVTPGQAVGAGDIVALIE